MDPFQQELELLGNLCPRDLRLSATVPDGAEVQVVTTCHRSKVAGGCRIWPGVRLGGAASEGGVA